MIAGLLAGFLLLVAAPGPALAQQPIPEGAGADSFQRFHGAPATQNPVDAPPLAPQHPFMTRNPWSNLHNDAYMTDAYEIPGPLGRGMTRRSTFLASDCASVTFDSRGRVVTICVGLDRPTLRILDPVTLTTLGSEPLPNRQPEPGRSPFQDFTGGGYFYLDHRDRAVLATTNRHLRTYAVEETGFRLLRDVDLNGKVAPTDAIVSALPDWSNRVWFVSRDGVVGAVDDAGTVRTHVTRERVTDSFSVDEDGGVYIVSAGALYRFDAGPDGAPVVTWRAEYDNSGVAKPGQVNVGSGTTPTLMAGGLVAIADNADPMNVVVYRRGRDVSGPRKVCQAPVFEKGASATDNSLIAVGNALVVENNYGYTGPPSTQNGRATAPGIERVDVDAERGVCTRVWHSDVISPTVVPKASLPNGLVYVYEKEPREDGEDLWYLTALDFRTGRTVWRFLAGEGLGHNNNYAPVTIGPDGSAYVGVLGGLVRLADETPPPGAPKPIPPSAAAATRTCLPPRLAVTSRGIGPVRLATGRNDLIALGGQPRRRSVRFCVRGGGTLTAALDARLRARLVLSTARGHRARRVARGTSTRVMRRAFRARRRVARAVYATGPSRRVLVGVGGRRVRWAAAIDRPTAVKRVLLRRAIRDALRGR